jgi:hypothetical protein
MDADVLAEWLHAVRRLRRGSLDFEHAPTGLRPFLGHGLGAVCDRLAAWVEETVADRRGTEATIRSFGLDPLPESLAQIGSTLRTRHDKGGDPLGGSFGLSNRQVQKLITSALGELSSDPAGPPMEATDEPLPSLSDPFPASGDMSSRPTMDQVVLWAWAQVPDDDRKTPAALMFYEYEHGLRADAARPPSRTERLRWRRLAWSVLQVAAYRFSKARTEGSARGGDRIIGPRRLVSVDTAEIPRASREGIDALMSLDTEPAAAGPGAVAAAVELVRAAVHSGHGGAPELLGLLRDSLRHRKIHRGPDGVAPRTETKIQALNTILAREYRDISGIPVGESAVPRLEQLLELRAVRRNPALRAELVSDHLRTLQELAELYDNLGLYAAASHTVDRLWERLDHLGDSDEAQSGGWKQQILLTTSMVDRHLAFADQNPQTWQQAAAFADRSFELALRDPIELPAPWAIAAATQRLWVAVEDLRREGGRDSARTERIRSHVENLLGELDAQRRLVTDTGQRSTRSALLGVRLVAWRIALLRGDPREIAQARAKTIKTLGAWTLPADLETIAEYQRAGARLGVTPDSTKIDLLMSRSPDRRHLRPGTTQPRNEQPGFGR